MTERKLLYSRQLPGGGWVTLEAEPLADELAAVQPDAPEMPALPTSAPTVHEPSPDTRVVLRVERRTDAGRRAGHAAPVIAEAVAPSETVAFEQLLPIAANNVQLAQRILRWQADRRGDGMMR